MPETIVIDPTSENATNVPLDLTADPYALLDQEYPPPPEDPLYTDSRDVEGDTFIDSRHKNREITLKIDVTAASDAAFTTARATLVAKLSKLHRQGGTLKRTLPSGQTIVFDVLQADFTLTDDITYSVGRYSLAEIKLTCKPYGRGAETNYSSHAEVTAPVLIFKETAAPAGDVPALARLVVTETQGIDQQMLQFGLQVATFDTADPATKKLFFEGEDRTTFQGFSAVSGASNANVAERDTFSGTSFIPILSTQASGGGAHLAHTGSYRVMARVRQVPASAEQCDFALDWGYGDLLTYTRNAPARVYAASTFVDVDLGVITIPSTATRWEGRILSRVVSGTGDFTIAQVDCFWLIPIDECSGRLEAVVRRTASASSGALSESYSHGSGAATGKSLLNGGTWVGAGSVNDFNYAAATGPISRTAVSDAATNLGTARVLTNSTGNFTRARVLLDCQASPITAQTIGVVARYTDINNFLALTYDTTNGLRIVARVAGTDTVISAPVTPSIASAFSLFLDVTPTGFVTGIVAANGVVVAKVTGYSAALATGGTLATGKVGMLERYTSATAATRSYANWMAWAPGQDAAVYASLTAEISSTGVTRQAIGTTIPAPVGRYEGDPPRIPPAGPEARGLRVIVKGSRGLPGIADPAIDDITAQLFYTPRYLVVPS